LNSGKSNSGKSMSKTSGLVCLFLIALTGCNLLQDSDVDNQQDLLPLAKAMAIGLGTDNQAREGTEVILTGKESDGQDAPILYFNWQADSDQILLKELTVNSVAFTAPNVSVNTDFSFQLTVTDSDGGQATDSITVTVVPARDNNKFLSFDALSDLSFDEYSVTLVPAENQSIDSANENFSISTSVLVKYPNRDSECVEYVSDNITCINYENNDSRALTEFNQSFDVEWNKDSDGNAINTDAALTLPRLILSRFNQQILDQGLTRDKLLDSWKADDIEIEITINTTTNLTAELLLNGVTTLGKKSRSKRFMDNAITTNLETIRNLSSGKLESKASTQSYYNTIDPNKNADTLSKWLVYAEFADQNSDGSISIKSQAEAGIDFEGSDFAHAKYTNNYDLGFGRDMYVRVAEDGSVYSYVVNYPTLEAAIKKINPLATVVMEYSPPAQGVPSTKPADYKFVKFYTYIPDETGQQIRVTDFDFDGRGQKYMPGVCAACHGGTPSNIETALEVPGVYPELGDINATFLPWDLESFLFSDTDPSILALEDIEADLNNLTYSRANQEEQFRKMNQAVYHIYKSGDEARFSSVIDLLGGTDSGSSSGTGSGAGTGTGTGTGWYSDVECSDSTNTNIDNKAGCLSGSFSDDYVPVGWSDEAEVYTDVYARHCRACHTVLSGVGVASNEDFARQFSSAADFFEAANVEKIKSLVFDKGVMPLARLTMDRLWTGTDDNPSPSETLWQSISDDPQAALVPPGLPVAKIEANAVAYHSVENTIDDFDYLLTKTGREIIIDGSKSTFAGSYDWRLLDSSGDTECLNEPSALVSNASVTGNGSGNADASANANASKATLTPLIANSEAQYYCVQLQLTNDRGTSNSNVIFVKARDNIATEVVAKSDCSAGVGNGCFSVSEINSNNEPSSKLLNSSFISLVDQDVTDGLDPATSIKIVFTSGPDFGSLNQCPTEDINDCLTADVDEVIYQDIGLIRYQTDQPEVGVTGLDDPIAFDVYDGAVLVAQTSASIFIAPVDDSAPMFSVQRIDLSLEFNQSNAPGFDFEVTDDDSATIDLTLINLSGKASLVNLTEQVSLGSPEATLTYTASTARQIAAASTGSNCNANFTPVAGRFEDTFNIDANDVNGNKPSALEVSVELSTNISYADAINEFVGTRVCKSCHGAEATGTEPRWASDHSVITSGPRFINIEAPETSTIFGPPPELSASHEVTDLNDVPLFVEWLYQCAPN
jgi:hypothetical protein